MAVPAAQKKLGLLTTPLLTHLSIANEQPAFRPHGLMSAIDKFAMYLRKQYPHPSLLGALYIETEDYSTHVRACACEHACWGAC